MKTLNRVEVLALILRVLLGVWFVYSGGMKLFVTGLDRFTRDIGNYKLLSPPWDAAGAYVVPWLELVAGLCLMLGFWRRGALGVMAGLVVAFSVFIAWAWSHQLDISCGCHGGDAPIQYWLKTVEFACYFGVIGWLLFQEKRVKISPSEQKLQNMA